MSKKSTNKIFSILAVAGYALLAIAALMYYLYTNVNAAKPPTNCPSGSYQIAVDDQGNPVCKQDPTGCPYGDSIPMDMCAKFGPVDEGPQTSPSGITPEFIRQVQNAIK